MTPARPLSQRLADERVDLDLIAQRIVKLAEIATLEHLESLLNSQAASMIDYLADADAAR
jgi:hypothetical protein